MKKKKKQQIIETYIFENDRYIFKVVSSHEIKEAETTAHYKDGDGNIMGSVDMPGITGDDTVENEHLTLEITEFRNDSGDPLHGPLSFQLRPEDFDGLFNMFSKMTIKQRGLY